MKNMKKMTALACAAMMMASMGITGCAKADGQTKEETKAVVVETPAGTLVAGAYRDGANCGISINLIKDGRFSTVLHTEYVEDEPFEGDLSLIHI